MGKLKYSDYFKVIPGVLLVIALIVIVFGDGIAAKRTTQQQATEYLDQASDRSAEELEKTFHRQKENIQTMAHMTAHIMDYEFVDTEKLVHLTDNNSFDGIEYIHKSGSCYGMNKKNWSVAEKDYFKDAVQKHVGYAFDDAKERGKGRCLVFYAPILSDNGAFDGILVGYLGEETIENMLDVSFWGHSTKQYLCTSDGTIVATNDPEKGMGSILEFYQNCGCMTEAETEVFSRRVKNKEGNFKYTEDGKTVLGSIGKVGDGEFMLVETFPPEILSELTSPQQRKMHLAFIHVVVSLIAYGVVMIIIGRRANKRLAEENDKVNKMLEGAEDLANQDGLTGLYNRRGMLKAIAAQNLDNKQAALLILDIDNFKQINDNYGHQVGDDLLLKLSGLMKEVFRTEDILVRMGGDEFLALLPFFKREEAEVIKRKVAGMNEKLQNPKDGLPAVSISVGAAFSRPGEQKELFRRADQALYETKARGRCGCCIYEEVFEQQEN